jgi:hypothetical protein
MTGESMLSFIPLHLSAVQRSDTLLDWMHSWTGPGLVPLTPDDWFQKGHDIRGWEKVESEPLKRPTIKAGVYGWFPPPSAADVALEQLIIARIKRQDSTNVFVCPRLLCPIWLKQMNKACDLIFKIPPRALGWPADMFEPLLIGVCFPFLRCKPWQFRGTPKMSFMARKLHDMRKDIEMDRGPFLSKFWILAHRLLTMSEHLVSRVLFFEQRDPISHSPVVERKRKGSRQRSGLLDLGLGETSHKKQRKVLEGP